MQIAGRDAYWMAEAARTGRGKWCRLYRYQHGLPCKKGHQRLFWFCVAARPRSRADPDRGGGERRRCARDAKNTAWLGHDCLNAADVAARAEDAGIQLVTIHGRTRCQFYKGSADWAAISAIKEAVLYSRHR